MLGRCASSVAELLRGAAYGVYTVLRTRCGFVCSAFVSEQDFRVLGFQGFRVFSGRRTRSTQNSGHARCCPGPRSAWTHRSKRTGKQLGVANVFHIGEICASREASLPGQVPFSLGARTCKPVCGRRPVFDAARSATELRVRREDVAPDQLLNKTNSWGWWGGRLQGAARSTTRTGTSTRAGGWRADAAGRAPSGSTTTASTACSTTASGRTTSAR